jgi:protein-disulfide isomerase
MTLRTLRPFVLALAVACGGAAQSHQEAVSLPHAGQGGADQARGALAQPTGKGETDAPVPIAAGDPVWGDRNALVTIVEFADFQCPFCARAAETVEQLKKEYGERTLRVVFKHEPLAMHPNARPCAEAAATVRALGGNAAFWTFYDLAYHDQQSLSPASYESWAQRAGVPLVAFRDALASHRYASKVDDDMAVAKMLGVEGTPAFFINGVSLEGAQPASKFREIIGAQIVAAKAKLEKGVAPGDVYTVAAKENYKPPSARDDDDSQPPDTTTVWKVPVGTSPQKGSKTALVTIIEFADFQCPYCKRVEATLQQIATTYGSNVRFVFKNLPMPFHPRALPAAEVALEARAEKGDAAFWAAHDKLFASQPQLDDADLDTVARDLKLDLAKVHAAMAKKKWQKVIDDDEALGDDFQAVGTPHFFINGRRLVGAQPFDKFKAIIDEELPKARALVTAGTQADKVYEELTKNGKTPPPPEQKTLVLAGSAPAKGAAHAKVTVVEFSDFQCPYCRRAKDTVDELVKAYPTQVRVVWRHMPLKFHNQAELAAEAGVEAFRQKGSAAFWRMHDQLYKHQTDPDGLARASIEGYAKKIGLDMKKFRAALDTGSNANTVDADAKAAQAAGITGTPTFIIGAGPATGSWTGYVLVGAQPLAKFKKLVDLALGAHP